MGLEPGEYTIRFLYSVSRGSSFVKPWLKKKPKGGTDIFASFFENLWFGEAESQPHKISVDAQGRLSTSGRWVINVGEPISARGR
jgi:hypothetical protein